MDGVLVVAKPAGPTSHDVVALIRRLSATRRVGHGGTLDPFAAGVLPVFLGVATRLVEYHGADRKAYRATVCFGASSTTDDLDGELTPVDAAPDRATVEIALARLRGDIVQRPPAFSAVIVGGRRAYALARAGQRPALPERRVTVHRLDLVAWDDADPARPIAVLEVECAAGTYVRALARDLGVATGGGAYLGALLRTASGPFRMSEAIDLDEIRAAAGSGPDGLRRLLRPPETGLDALERIVVSDAERRDLVEGRFILRPSVSGTADGGALLVADGNGALVGVARRVGERLAPDKILVARDPA